MKLITATRVIAAAGLLAAPTYLYAEEGDAQKQRAEMFSRLDANGDGTITKDEIPEERREQIERL